MSWMNLRSLEYPVLNTDDEIVALFVVEEERDRYVDFHNGSLNEADHDLRVHGGDYLDIDTDVSIRGS